MVTSRGTWWSSNQTNHDEENPAKKLSNGCKICNDECVWSGRTTCFGTPPLFERTYRCPQFLASTSLLKACHSSDRNLNPNWIRNQRANPLLLSRSQSSTLCGGSLIWSLGSGSPSMLSPRSPGHQTQSLLELMSYGESTRQQTIFTR